MQRGLILLIVILTVTFAVKAQGNLQFNQVLHVKFSAIGSAGSNLVGTVTVPAGKVWKIEGGSLINSTSFGPVIATWCLTVDGHTIAGAAANGSSGGYIGYFPTTGLSPLWLGAGTYNVNLGGAAVNSIPYTAAISVIEYNIIP